MIQTTRFGYGLLAAIGLALAAPFALGAAGTDGAQVSSTTTSAVGAPAAAPSPAASAKPRPKEIKPVFSMAVTVDDLPFMGEEIPGTTRMETAQKFISAFKANGMENVYGFVNGDKVGKHPETFAILKAWVEAGHLLGNHTWSHPTYEFTSSGDFIQDIAANEKILASLLPEKDYKWFRFPFLSEGNTPEKRRAARQYLTEKHYQIAPVTMDFQDWRWVDPYERCLAAKKPEKIDELKALYFKSARQRLALARASGKLLFDREIPQILLLHINVFTASLLDQLLAFYKSEGAVFTEFKVVMQDRALRSDPGMPWPVGKDLLSSMIEARKISYPEHALLPVTELAAICR